MTNRSLTACALGVCAVVILVPAWHWWGDLERRAERFVASGDEYAAQGRFKEAAIEYRNALKHHPGDPDTEFKLGTAYDALGERARAHQAFVRVTQLDGRRTDAGVRVAKVLLADARFADAQRYLETILRHEPQNVTALVLLGGVYAGLGKQTSALAKAEQALAIDPESAIAHILLGSIRLRAGEREEAGAAFAKATQLAPDSSEAWISLGRFRWALGEFEAAERALTRAMAVGRDLEKLDLHRTLAAFYVRAGRAAEAERHFVAAAHEDDTGRVRLADYYLGMGRRTDALKVLAGVVSETDSVDRRIRAVAQLRIAWLRHASGDRRGADEAVTTVLNDPAVAADAQLLKSRFLLEAGNLDEAFTHAREAARLQPAAAGPRSVLGQVHMARGEWAEAEKELERARARAPGEGQIELELARVRAELHVAAGDLDAAIADYERIAGIEEKPTAALTAIGMLKAQLGDRDGARAAYARALQIDPAAGIAANNLAWIYAQQGLLNDALRLASVAQHSLANGAPALDTSGWVHYLKGAADSAIDLLERAVQAEPNEALYRYHLGAALLKAGQRQRAEREFRTALELSSDFEGAAEARQLLAKLQAVVE